MYPNHNILQLWIENWNEKISKNQKMDELESSVLWFLELQTKVSKMTNNVYTHLTLVYNCHSKQESKSLGISN